MGRALKLFGRIAMQFLTSMISVDAAFWHEAEKSLPPPKQVTQAARNPPANSQLASPAPHGVIFWDMRQSICRKAQRHKRPCFSRRHARKRQSTCGVIPTLQSWNGAVLQSTERASYTKTPSNTTKTKLFSPADKNNAYSMTLLFFSTKAQPRTENPRNRPSHNPLPPDTKEPLWVEGAQIILTGAILHFHHKKNLYRCA